ncbi:MAG: hypothetical protein ABR601_03545 [Parasphingopyxis sp.]|nr:hypothetical protein [Sphingomonadales bacterium]
MAFSGSASHVGSNRGDIELARLALELFNQIRKIDPAAAGSSDDALSLYARCLEAVRGPKEE